MNRRRVGSNDGKVIPGMKRDVSERKYAAIGLRVEASLHLGDFGHCMDLVCDAFGMRTLHTHGFGMRWDRFWHIMVPRIPIPPWVARNKGPKSPAARSEEQASPFAA
jgi:hypothetical protein